MIMTLPNKDDGYKTLNEDVKLKSDEYGNWDLDMDNGDYINVSGLQSLKNACIIAIMTRINEVKNSTYEGFGCGVHDVIKDNKTKLVLYKIETEISETLSQMRRIKQINSLEITEDESHSYLVQFSVTSINDEIARGSVSL